MKIPLWIAYAVFAASIVSLVWFGICFANQYPVPRFVMVLAYLWPLAGFAIAIFRKKLAAAPSGGK